MKGWAKLTPDQRRQARERYENVRKATPEQREALKQMWSEYQALPEEEKNRLKRSSVKSGIRPDTPSRPVEPSK
jgi:hypothetical protein